MKKIYDITNEKLIFTNKALWALLIPVMLEQFLNTLMGMADTMMVSRVSAAAISAVALVDSINILVIQIFSAMAAGATIVCAQYIGSGNDERSNDAAKQVTLTVTCISMLAMLLCLLFYKPLLNFVFGAVEPDVMKDSITYFVVTAISFPFIALFSAGSAFFRAGGESRFPMIVSVISNVINVIGNAVFIFVFDMGVFGAAMATLLSRVFCMVVVFAALRKPTVEGQKIILKNYFTIRPDFPLIAKILSVGIPSGIENGMFQFGKLAIQSSVSLLGTAAIAAHAMVTILENLNGIAAMGMGIGLMTIVGQCVGGGKIEQAKYYIVKITVWAWIVVLVSCMFVFAITKPVIYIAGMEALSAKLCFDMMIYVSLVKPIPWAFSFVPGYGMRAAGDVKYSMIVSSLTMWFCRVLITTILIRVMGVGPIAVWIGMSCDWFVRAVIFTHRFFTGKWVKQLC